MAQFNLSLKEASQITGYHPDYISSLIRTGKIKGEKIGRNWFTSRDEVSRHLTTKKYSSLAHLARKFIIPGIVILGLVGLGIYYVLAPGSSRSSSGVQDNSRDEDVPAIINSR